MLYLFTYWVTCGFWTNIFYFCMETPQINLVMHPRSPAREQQLPVIELIGSIHSNDSSHRHHQMLAVFEYSCLSGATVLVYFQPVIYHYIFTFAVFGQNSNLFLSEYFQHISYLRIEFGICRCFQKLHLSPEILQKVFFFFYFQVVLIRLSYK